MRHSGKGIAFHMRDDVEEAATRHAVTGPPEQDK
jgi:hypothetical protein